jgi:DmsE family decaheme c-type cytochrome
MGSVTCAFALLIFHPAAAVGQKHTGKTPEKKWGDEYVGSQACGACHEDIYNNLLKTAHVAVENQSAVGWKDHACESCHGPGAKHAGSADAADIRNPAKLTAQQTDGICLTCHLNTAKNSERIQSSHMKDLVPCTTCHSVHGTAPGSLVARTAPQINAQCTECHLDVKAQFAKPFRHKIPENEMTCADCHSPHGTSRKAMIENFASNEPGCFQCHGDKRGPFTFEHAPVK